MRQEPMQPKRATATKPGIGQSAIPPIRPVVDLIRALLVLLIIVCGLHACGGEDLTFPGDTTGVITAAPTTTETPE